MKKLLSTSALVVALGFPALVFAQSAADAANEEVTTTVSDQKSRQQNADNSGFLAERGQSDLFATDLLGQDVYARRRGDDTDANDGQAADNAGGTNDMARMNRAELDEMDSIGQINELVLSNDGQIRAVVIGVGGFLGVGEQDVAVTMDQVTFASDADDPSQMYIVVNTGASALESAPAYERSIARSDAASGEDENDRSASNNSAQGDEENSPLTTNDAATGNNGTRADERTAFEAPQMDREGYDQINAEDVSTEMLMGKSVYDVNDNDVGTVDDMIIDDAGEITNVIIDFGGFLGIGSSQASLNFDEVTIMTDEGYADVRLYVDATKEQIEGLPQYTASE